MMPGAFLREASLHGNELMTIYQCYFANLSASTRESGLNIAFQVITLIAGQLIVLGPSEYGCAKAGMGTSGYIGALLLDVIACRKVIYSCVRSQTWK